jgi:hypothetical protein
VLFFYRKEAELWKALISSIDKSSGGLADLVKRALGLGDTDP